MELIKVCKNFQEDVCKSSGMKTMGDFVILVLSKNS